MSKQRTTRSVPILRGAAPRPAEPEIDRAEAQPEADSIEHEAQLLSKSGETYNGGLGQRAALTRQIQRRLGNSHTQRVVARARGEQAEPGRADAAIARLPLRGARIQRDIIDPNLPTSFGAFNINMVASENAATGGASGLAGDITFNPDKSAPYSNKIGLIQIVKLTDTGGTNVEPQSLPTAYGPHLRTKEDKAGGVEGGFFTDVLHNDFGNTNKDAPPRSALPPHYAGGTPIFGFKRSELPADIKAASLHDTPGTGSATGGLKFSFETVARGDDVQHSYGSIKWAFEVKDGKVINETTKPVVTDDPSATFEAAMEKHRDFYTHEPLTFYFEFDSRALAGTETAKINAEVLDYMTRNNDVRLRLVGRADLIGNATYNQQLSRDRIEAARAALIAAGIDSARINATAPADVIGATTDKTTDAVTAQAEDPNRRGNRQVEVIFERTPLAAPPAAATP